MSQTNRLRCISLHSWCHSASSSPFLHQLRQGACFLQGKLQAKFKCKTKFQPFYEKQSQDRSIHCQKFD